MSDEHQTDLRLLRELNAKRTPGEWKHSPGKDGASFMSFTGPNGETIVGGCGCCQSPFGVSDDSGHTFYNPCEADHANAAIIPLAVSSLSWLLDAAERGLEAQRLMEQRNRHEQLAERQKFKDWVHNYLDTHGVPHHPPGTHGEHGCRIGDRMDWLMEQLANKEWECGELRELFRVTDCAVASMSDAADAAAEHFDEDGDLRGDGKWRIRQIHSSVRAIQSEFNRVVVEHSRIKANIAPAAEGGPA